MAIRCSRVAAVARLFADRARPRAARSTCALTVACPRPRARLALLCANSATDRRCRICTSPAPAQHATGSPRAVHQPCQRQRPVLPRNRRCRGAVFAFGAWGRSGCAVEVSPLRYGQLCLVAAVGSVALRSVGLIKPVVRALAYGARPASILGSYRNPQRFGRCV